MIDYVQSCASSICEYSSPGGMHGVCFFFQIILSDFGQIVGFLLSWYGETQDNEWPIFAIKFKFVLFCFLLYGLRYASKCHACLHLFFGWVAVNAPKLF